jgi:serine/threonine-protein kinase
VSNLTFIREIGKGSFGSVWLGRDRGTRALRAVKLVSPSSIPNLASFNEEAKVLNLLQHPNIISVYGTEIGPLSGIGPDCGMYAIIMEYMAGGSLEDQLAKSGPLLLSEAIHRFAEACRGAERVHASGFVHRDIKPANILIDGSKTKLSDFGLVQSIVPVPGSTAGTPYYLAPEVFQGESNSQSSDIYSLGVTLYELINGSRHLEWTGSFDAFFDAVVRGKYPDRTEYAPFVPASIRKILTKALHPSPAKRFASVADLRHAITTVPIRCSWRREIDTPETWLGMGDGLFRVVLQKSSIEVARCKTAPGQFRKNSADCLYNAASKDIRSHQKIVMQRITTDGR